MPVPVSIIESTPEATKDPLQARIYQLLYHNQSKAYSSEEIHNILSQQEFEPSRLTIRRVKSAIYHLANKKRIISKCGYYYLKTNIQEVTELCQKK